MGIETESLTTTQASDVPTPRRKPLGRRVMHHMRRLHLFLGLLLLPWALVYGVSGFLFNHPTAFPDQPTRAFGPDEVRGTPLDGLPRPAELAEEVVAALNEKGGAYRVVRPDEAAFARNRVTVQARGPGVEHAVAVDLTDSTGTVRTKPTSGEPTAPFAATSGVRTQTSLPDRLQAGTPVVLRNAGLDADEAGAPATMPDLTFYMEADGQVWRVTYQFGRGAVSGRPADAPGQGLSTRRFLTQLHLAREYPRDVGARWFWAVAVDVMAFVMVFWAVSGLFMWWQIKAVRGWGAVALAVGAATAALMGLGMHRTLSP